MVTMSSLALPTSLRDMKPADWALLAFTGFLVWNVVITIYNLFFHPLARVPGPWLAKVSRIPNWWHSTLGDRHIWLWQQFQRYGSRVRAAPDMVLFCDGAAILDIYGTKANVRRGDFYVAFRRNAHDISTLTEVDNAKHARRRKLLATSFTEKSVRAASWFVIRHVDRWNELLVADTPGNEWSETVNFSDKIDGLVFDLMGDLSFGKSFGIKEPGENPLKDIPHIIAVALQFFIPISHSPLLSLVVALKPRGLDTILQAIAPAGVKRYWEFVNDSVNERLALQAADAKADKAEDERRQDMFHFLCEARDPDDKSRPAFNETELRAEANLLIVAGSDTTSVSLSGIFFYLTGDPWRCQKLAEEIRTTFASEDDIVHGPQLLSCKYLRACIDEGMRLAPAGPSEMPRQVLKGGIRIQGDYYPEGTIVGVPAWAKSRNPEAFSDVDVFRPERWIVDETTGVTAEDVAAVRTGHFPFSTGPFGCLGKNLAMTEMMLVIARTLYRLDVRRTPGSTLGGGKPELGWGRRDHRQYHVKDAYIAIRNGPEVQFRRRTT